MPADVHIKVCGLTCVEDADACLALGVGSLGLNLVASSPRAIDLAVARRITEHVAGRSLVVLVVADQPLATMKEWLVETGAACLQLHGSEPPSALEPLLPHAYKAVRVGAAQDIELALTYPGEHLLVDAKVKGQLGGTGQVVDFTLVAPLARRRKLTLAGGLNARNVAAAIAAVRPFCVDVASGVELAGNPRRKSHEELAAFVRAVRSAPPAD